MRISDWSSDVCSSDLVGFHDKVRKAAGQQPVVEAVAAVERQLGGLAQALEGVAVGPLEHLGRGREQRRGRQLGTGPRSEEHTPELQSLMRISYAVFCLKKKTKTHNRQS